ncbi:hypothetical protein M426DRAFT_65469 [Hypoxylon sp. CI-4A]|nr:hypothetical protein M426DRAFT_65469 [Hypoxylon sp. CI-4A]
MNDIGSHVGALSLKDTCVSLAALTIVFYIISASAAWYRLRHIPGPFLASLSHLWIIKGILFGSLGKDLTNLRNYGPLTRNGPNSIVTNDPDILKNIASARTKYTKNEWYSVILFAPGQRNLITTLDNQTHDKMKAKTAGGYNGRENPDVEVAMDSQINHFIEVIRQKHMTTKDNIRNVDFAKLSRYFTLDMITRLAYGKALGFLDCDGDLYNYTYRLDQILYVQNLAQEVPFLRRIVYSNFFLGLFGPKATDENGMGKIMGLTEKIINDRFDQAKPTKDMLGSFIHHGLTRKECCDEALLQILAGADTTAVAIRGTFLYHMSTPRVYARLKDMIKQCVERNEVSQPITYDQAQKLPYLQAVILEGFRMKTPVTYGHYKQTPPEGDTINGVYIPGNTMVGHNSLAICRTESIWGEDVETFRPERFIDCDEETRAKRKFALDIIFGNGRWMCAGKPIALMELNKIFFELLRVFDFQLINPSKGWDEIFYFLPFHKNIWVKITEAET